MCSTGYNIPKIIFYSYNSPPNVISGPTCDGIPSTDWTCCSVANPCDVGEGDCDNDSECVNDLVCGYNNCQPGVSGSNWNSVADCCQGAPHYLKYLSKVFPSNFVL